MDVSQEMNKVAFDVIKARAKRKAQNFLGNVSAGYNWLKQRRTEDPQNLMQGAESLGRVSRQVRAPLGRVVFMQ
jgi:hypothetical protein